MSDGHYRKHVDHLRGKLDKVRDMRLKQLEQAGLTFDNIASAGMFVWAETGCNTNILTEKALDEGYLLAPGSLFSPNQLPSTRMRINIASTADTGFLKFLAREIGR